MNQLAIFVFLLFLDGIADAQPHPRFELLRQDEDYRFLKDDTGKNWYKQMKYISFGKNKLNYLSMGGDMRHQVFYFKNENWGASPEEKDGFIFSRVITHADLHLGESFRTFVQLQSSLVTGKSSTSPVDKNSLDLQQAFFDISIPAGASGSFILRTGRQELNYGAQRLVTVGEGPNNRQAFDALKVRFKNTGITADVFYSYHVKDRKGVFDDRFNKDQQFFGGYLTKNNVSALKQLDVYYFGLSKKASTFDDGAGRELRHSIGSRIWGSAGKWHYDFEGVYQFGSFSGKQIRAWTMSSDIRFKVLTWRFSPELRMKSELISGDKNYGDVRLQTFNPLFPRGAYFGLAALIGPVNLFDLHPSVTLTLIENQLSAELDYDAFWRFSKNDGLYGPGAVLTYSGKNTSKKFIGHQAALNLDYEPNRFLSFTAEITWFKAQGYLEAVSPGKDILFTGLTSQLKF